MLTGEPDGASAESALLSEHLSSLGTGHVMGLVGHVCRPLSRLEEEKK